MDHRDAAVLIADIVGHDPLGQADEAGGARFRADLQALLEPQIAAHQGRLIGARNGGLLIEFPAAADAVSCAIDLQRDAAGRNRELPAERRLDLRIGIDLGEVTAEGDDVEGDSVAVADRLQGLADPGEIMLSAAARDRVEGRLDLGFEDLGKLRGGAFAEPVRVYRVPVAAAAVSGAAVAAGAGLRLPWWWPAAAAMLAVAVIGVALSSWPRPAPSPAEAVGPPAIAVLPFATIDGEAGQAYLADGLTEELTARLARTPGLLVISRNAAFGYRAADVEPVRAAVELGVRYVLTGKLGRTDAGLHIDARLIDAKRGSELWLQHFDGAWADVFRLEDQLSGAVAIALQLQPDKAAERPAGETRIPAAYDAYLRGVASIRRGAAPDLAGALPDLQKAVALDPTYGAAQAALANAYWLATGQSQGALGVSYDEAIAKANAYLAEAMKYPSPRAYRVAAEMSLYQQDFDAALNQLKHAAALDPSDSENYAWLAYASIMTGQPAQGQGYVEQTLRLEPRAVEWLGFTIGLGQFCTDRFAAAAATLEKAVAAYPSDTASRILLAATYGQLGRGREAAALFDDINAIAVIGGRPPWTELRTRQWFGFKEVRDAQRLRQGLSNAGVPALPFGYDPQSKDRLTGGEMEKMLLGRTIRGRGIDSGEPFSLTMGDGGASFSFGQLSDSGRFQAQDDALCYAWPKYGRSCAAIFRNPGGTAEQQDEYVWVSGVDRIQFSIAQ